MRKKSQPTKCVRFQEPLLLAIVTIDNVPSKVSGNFRVRLGVFLCSRRNTNDELDEFRVSLLWHSQAYSLEDASALFGTLLRVSYLFKNWRDQADQQLDQYEYFSSNCCRFGDYVFRSYDSRFRPTNRSPEIYLSPECRSIVGEGAVKVVELPENDATTSDFHEIDNCTTRTDWSSCNDSFWNTSKSNRLLIIATPYRAGGHVAENLKAFLPIIAQLEALHEKAFVHGDIRAFNTVFGEQEGQAYLIDFDFGGKLGSRYPKGYRATLSDGLRLGVGEEGHPNNIISPRHDWYALGRLIFSVHRVLPPEGNHEEHLELQFFRTGRFWGDRSIDSSPDRISELKDLLCLLDEQGWTVEPSAQFSIELEENNAWVLTKRGASGSPPEKEKKR